MEKNKMETGQMSRQYAASAVHEMMQLDGERYFENAITVNPREDSSGNGLPRSEKGGGKDRI